ncbi:MAG: twin-arginine translocase TatA/TatE family subunit [Muribaculaceae bacterium]|nr:twin-arginine translocase TatA/TatE family subunit [Muribaculaceae bacterium]
MTLQFIPLFLGNIRGWEWLIILVIVLLLFGGKKIPELMKGVGKGISSFREGLNDAKKEIEEEVKKSDNPDKNTDSK